MTDTDEDDGSGIGVVGREVYCSSCTAPIVLTIHKQHGYRLACACKNTAVNVDSVAAESTLFEAITGKWSGVDDVDTSFD